MNKQLTHSINLETVSVRPRHDEDTTASRSDLRNAHEQMTSPSKDWSQLGNILRRSCGGFSRTRSPRHSLPRSKRNG
ncbi:hypothetical protein FIC94_21765 [Ochrobactrum teleogrylli]|uniref:Uncharacterized protein n=1 Tax=Ochrobactrum teleogrylli TaxID=2479765 RepID=A0ABY2XYB0_9HYPH|nr:hypothetical protein FIC94_21765 [[Ochrobactrum] teleogrylli]